MLPKAESYAELLDQFRWKAPQQYNIGVDVCDKWANSQPDRLALIHNARNGEVTEFTFADLKRLSNQVANLLTAHGLQPGDRMGVLLPQAPETGYVHIAIYKLGAIAVPLFTLFGPDALAYRLDNCAAKAVITDATGVEKLDQIRGDLLDLKLVFNIDGPHPGCLDFHAERSKQSEMFQPLDTQADDPALIIYTSGTTGQPKGALHAHRVLLGHLPGIEMSHNFLPQPGDRLWTPADWVAVIDDIFAPDYIRHDLSPSIGSCRSIAGYKGDRWL